MHGEDGLFEVKPVEAQTVWIGEQGGPGWELPT